MAKAKAESSTAGSRTPALSPDVSSSTGGESPKVSTPGDSSAMDVDASSDGVEFVGSSSSSKRKKDANTKDDEPPSKRAKTSVKSANDKGKAKETSKTKPVKPVKAKAEPKDKKEPKEKALVELKGNRLVYKSSNLNLASHTGTMKQLLDLKAHIESLEEPVSEYPEEHYSILAKLVHESEKTLNDLAKQIKTAIVPEVSQTDMDVDEKKTEILPIKVIKTAIELVATRKDYGIASFDEAGIELDDDDEEKPSLGAGFHIYRWEVNDRPEFLHDGLPADLVAKIESRVVEREQVKDLAVELVTAIDEEDRLALLSAKKRVKGEEGEKNSKSKAKELTAEEIAEKAKKEELAAARKVKKAENEEKKAVAKAELEKKEASKQKQANVMAAFFGTRPPPVASSSGAKPASSPIVSKKAAKVEPKESSEYGADFARAFKSFFVAKDVELFKVIYLQKPKQKVYPLSEMVDSKPDLTVKDILSEFAVGPRNNKIPHNPRPKPKYSVKTLIKNINENELTGQDGEDWSQILHDRRKVPLKLFSFQATDRRPGYIGTFSKTSRVIRPRQPFGRDTGIFDYEYDSEAEWDEEEDAEGEDVNSDDARSAGSDEDEENSLMGDWMCHDDEVEFLEGHLEGDENAAPSQTGDLDFDSHQRAVAKREQAAKDANRRKKAKPLVPVHIGPKWESTPGSAVESFASLRIQFLNDAFFSMNPNTFVGKTIQMKKAESGKATLDVIPVSAKDGQTVLKPVKASRPFPEHLLQDFVTAAQNSTTLTKESLKTELVAKFPSATKVSIENLLKMVKMVKVKLSKTEVERSWEVEDALVTKAAGASAPGSSDNSSQ